MSLYARSLQRKGTTRDLGIRSLKSTVTSEVENVLIGQYLRVEELIAEGKGPFEYFLDTRKGMLVVTSQVQEPEEEL